jgi:hypothetical protein
MKAFRWLVVVAALSLAQGCAEHVPPLNFSVPNVGPSATRFDAEVRSLTVTVGRPDEQVGPVHVMMAESAGTAVGSSQALTANWREALQEALDRHIIFRDDGRQKVSISVKILRLEIPFMGASFTTNAVARYEIIDRANGDIIFRQDVASAGTVPADFAFLGVIRARESINRAVQNNIASFLQQLQTADMARPMFPANASPVPVSRPEQRRTGTPTS